MKDYLNEINDSFPIRRTNEEKSSFFEYVSKELGYERVKKESIDKNNNIIIGDIAEAKVVFTAHYDTPATSLIPNFMMPANKILGSLIQISYFLIIAIFSLLIAFGIGDTINLDDSEIMLIYLLLYFGFTLCSTRLITNKNNKNDNTSGVATIMSIASEITDSKASFILFDNEEKGLLGSKAFNRKHKKLMESKLVINLDCVGNGDNIIFIVKDKVKSTAEYKLLCDAFKEKDDHFAVHHIPFQRSNGNSDHKSFPCSVGVMAARKGRIVKFFTGRIHTARDTVADNKNIDFLYTRFSEFIKKL